MPFEPPDSLGMTSPVDPRYLPQVGCVVHARDNRGLERAILGSAPGTSWISRSRC